jgi:hypothetical protein
MSARKTLSERGLFFGIFGSMVGSMVVAYPCRPSAS